ncbi:hypothetical protein GE061_017280, partial [Apolygus lucorum]
CTHTNNKRADLTNYTSGLEDFPSEDHRAHTILQIGVDDKLQDFICRTTRYRISEENVPKSADCISDHFVWLPDFLPGILRRTWKKSGDDGKTEWVGFHRIISLEKSKSLQRYSSYSVWLQNLLARSKRTADLAEVAHLDGEEGDSKWVDPVDVLAHKTMKHVGVVSKASKALKSFNAAVHLYKSFVRPIVELSLPVTSPYKMTDLAHNSGTAQSKILKSMSDAAIPEPDCTDGCKLASEFVLLYKILNGFANSPGVMSRINVASSLRPLIFHNQLFSHRFRGTKYPEEGLALFILLKVTPHQFTSFQKYCLSIATDSLQNL